MTTNITQSLSLLRQVSTLPATSSNMCKRPTKWVLDPLLGTASAMMTVTKRTTQMPQQYHPNLKGKGWVLVTDTEVDKGEIDKV